MELKYFLIGYFFIGAGFFIQIAFIQQDSIGKLKKSLQEIYKDVGKGVESKYMPSEFQLNIIATGFMIYKFLTFILFYPIILTIEFISKK
jgi:hypothetical protein